MVGLGFINAPALVGKLNNWRKANRYKQVISRPLEKYREFLGPNNLGDIPGMPKGLAYIHQIFPTLEKRIQRAIEKEGRNSVEVMRSLALEAVEAGQFNSEADFILLLTQYIDRYHLLFSSVRRANFLETRNHSGEELLRQLAGKAGRKGKSASLVSLLKNNPPDLNLSTTAHPTDPITSDNKRNAVLLSGHISTVELLKPRLKDRIVGENRKIKTYREHALERIKQTLRTVSVTRSTYPEKITSLREGEHTLQNIGEEIYQAFTASQAILNEYTEAEASRLQSANLSDQVDLAEKAKRPKPSLKLSGWECFDRDGHPGVTAGTSYLFALMKKSFALKLHIQYYKELIRKLSFCGKQQDLTEILNKLERTLTVSENKKDALEEFLNSGGNIQDFKESIPAQNGFYHSEEELLDELLAVRNKISFFPDPTISRSFEEFICGVEIFGFHFSQGEVRQNTRAHTKALDDIISLNCDKNYSQIEHSERLDILARILNGESSDRFSLKNSSAIEDMTREILDTLAVIPRIQREVGVKACETYIMSNSEYGKLNIRELLALVKLAGLDYRDLNLDIVPLLETPDVLEKEKLRATVQEIIDPKDPFYAAHLLKRAHAEWMLGFSDSALREGFFAANWDIYNAHYVIDECVKELKKAEGFENFETWFFYGRGYSAARSGRSIEEQYKAWLAERESPIHQTIQGMGKFSDYGSKDVAQYYSSKLLVASLSGKLFPEEQYQLTDEDKKLLEFFSQAVKKKFESLVNDEQFVQYFFECTPFQFKHNFGSRPEKHNARTGASLDSIRAIPGIESFAQMAQHLFIFYGIGDAMKSLNPEQVRHLRALCEKSSFVKSCFDTVSYGIDRSNMALTKHLAGHSKFGAIWNNINDEYLSAKNEIKKFFHKGKNTSLLVGSDSAENELRDSMRIPAIAAQQFAIEGFKGWSEFLEELAQSGNVDSTVVKNFDSKQILLLAQKNPSLLPLALSVLAFKNIQSTASKNAEEYRKLATKLVGTIMNTNGRS